MPGLAQAGDHRTCYIDNFLADYQLNTDSSLNVTEQITVACAEYDELHGIFRILPTVQPLPEGSEDSDHNPITLESITDLNSNPYNFKTQNDTADTITWKIGDADRLITQPTTYVIKYSVENTVHAGADSLDHLDWDIHGDSWEWPVKKYRATFTLPQEVAASQVQAELKAGSFGNQDTAGLVKLDQSDESTFTVSSLTTIPANNAVTLKLAFPTGLVTHYVPPPVSPWVKLLFYLFFASFIVPFIAFVICYRIWKKYGQDIKIRRSVAPEFAVPGNLRPLELAVLGMPKTVGLEAAATLIDLAVRGHLVISERPKSFFGGKKYDFEKTVQGKDQLSKFEQQFMNHLTSYKKKNGKLSLDDAMENVGKHWSELKKTIENDLGERELLDLTGKPMQVVMIVVGFFSLCLITVLPGFGLAGVVIFIFAALMSKRTTKGAELLHQARGFLLYMKTAERYRQVFNEKENIFERFLPYAIFFGIAKQWAQVMEKLYGDNFKNYHPAWYVGASTFDSANFASSISSIAHSVSSSAGSSAGGGSGGGGGGGGGGGW